jgi:hypothetical protein
VTAVDDSSAEPEAPRPRAKVPPVAHGRFRCSRHQRDFCSGEQFVVGVHSCLHPPGGPRWPASPGTGTISALRLPTGGETFRRNWRRLFGIGVDRDGPARTRWSRSGANRTDQTLRPPAFVAAAGSCLPFVRTSCLDLIDIPDWPGERPRATRARTGAQHHLCKSSSKSGSSGSESAPIPNEHQGPAEASNELDHVRPNAHQPRRNGWPRVLQRSRIGWTVRPVRFAHSAMSS